MRTAYPRHSQFHLIDVDEIVTNIHHDTVREKCQRIRDSFATQDEYDAWWQSTPDDNAGFDAAVDAKLAELEQVQS
jgi:hypothetical protein